jgi:UDP-glucose 4-epimerase
MDILVTGAAGYIGTHTLVELLNHGHRVVALDSFINSHPAALDRVRRITGKPFSVIEGDIRDTAMLSRLFQEHAIDAVIHFAGLKAVGESVTRPLAYYQANVAGTLALCHAMAEAGVYRLVFSSSATVYGEDAPVPYHEGLPRGVTANPYGATKAMVERMLEDLCQADARWAVSLLRYFNPIGAHPSGLIGEDPLGPPNNLMPYVAQVAAGRRDTLAIFGNDYPTPDGTCVRDYLHVVDLALGHLKALEALDSAPGCRAYNLGTGRGHSVPGCRAYNLGTGRGHSVLELVDTFMQVTGVPVAYRFAPRRAGDLAAFWANPEKARRELGWHAERPLEAMLADTWRWQSANPQGYTK